MKIGKKELGYLLIPVLYVISGKAALMLALPPGYASAIFPPAGIAITAAYIIGNRALPWVFLGSFLLNTWAGEANSHQPSTITFIAALLVAVASIFQAALGGWMLRRAMGYPALFDNVRDIFKLFALVPAICLTSATLSVASLWVVGIFDALSVVENWFSWWIGDSLGTMVLLPIILAFVGEPRELWRGRVKTVAIPMVLTLAVFITIFLKTNQWEREESLAEFRQLSQRLSNQIKAGLDEQASVVLAMSGLFAHDAKGKVSRREFHRFAESTLPYFPMIQALEWAPRVDRSHKADFEAGQRRDIPKFTITERDETGKLQRTGERNYYYPLTYVEPILGNEPALGFDLASTPDRRDAIISSSATRQPSATPPIHLVQANNPVGLLILQSVSSGNMETGVVLTVIKAGNFIAKSVPAYNGVLHMRLFDDDTQTPLYDDFGAETTEAYFDYPFDFGSRHYHVQTAPSAGYLRQHRGWQSWTVLALGTLGASVFGGFLLLGTGYTARVVGQVEERTAELRGSEARLKRAQQSAHVGNWEMDLVNGKLHLSDEIYRIFEIDPLTLGDFNTALMNAVHPDDRERVSNTYTNSLVTRETCDIVYRLQFIDGRVKFVRERRETLFDQGGIAIHSMVTVQDITRMEELRRALSKSEEQARTAIDASRSALWDYNVMTGCVHLSDAWAHLLGGEHQPTDTSADALMNLVPAEEQPLVMAAFMGAIKGSKSALYQVEHRVRKNDGSYIWVHSEGKVVERDAQGLATRMLGINRDITEQKRIESALKESEARLHLLIDYSPAALAMFDTEMRYLAASKRWLREYGLQGQNIIGRSYYETSPETSQHWKELHRAGLQGNALHSDGEPFQGTDGNIHWLRWDIRPWRSEEGVVGGIVLFTEDMTEAHEKYVAEMRERDARYRTAIETAQDGFLMLDMDGAIVEVNEAYARNSGYARGQLLRMHIWDLNEQKSKQTVLSRMRELANAGGHARFEGVHKRSDGSTWPTDVTVSFSSLSGGRYFVFITDLSEKKQAALSLQKAREAVYRDTLVREVHHRIKNNLQGLIGILRRHVRAHPETGNAVNSIIGQIQSIAVTHGLQGNVEFRKILLSNLLTAIVQQAQSIWLSPIKIDVPPVCDNCSVVESESVPIALILNELVANATKHGRPGGDISISLQYDKDDCTSAIVTISNEGALPKGFCLDDGSSLSVGLQLVLSLMPQIGAKLSLKQDGQNVVSVLELGSPVISASNINMPHGGTQ